MGGCQLLCVVLLLAVLPIPDHVSWAEPKIYLVETNNNDDQGRPPIGRSKSGRKRNRDYSDMQPPPGIKEGEGWVQTDWEMAPSEDENRAAPAPAGAPYRAPSGNAPSGSAPSGSPGGAPSETTSRAPSGTPGPFSNSQFGSQSGSPGRTTDRSPSPSTPGGAGRAGKRAGGPDCDTANQLSGLYVPRTGNCKEPSQCDGVAICNKDQKCVSKLCRRKAECSQISNFKTRCTIFPGLP